jgi:hypothetical protein
VDAAEALRHPGEAYRDLAGRVFSARRASAKTCVRKAEEAAWRFGHATPGGAFACRFMLFAILSVGGWW